MVSGGRLVNSQWGQDLSCKRKLNLSPNGIGFRFLCSVQNFAENLEVYP